MIKMLLEVHRATELYTRRCADFYTSRLATPNSGLESGLPGGTGDVWRLSLQQFSNSCMQLRAGLFDEPPYVP